MMMISAAQGVITNPQTYEFAKQRLMRVKNVEGLIDCLALLFIFNMDLDLNSRELPKENKRCELKTSIIRQSD